MVAPTQRAARLRMREKSSANINKELYKFNNPEEIHPMYEKTTKCLCLGH